MLLINDCYSCIYKRDVPRNYHIKCIKPDLNMKGNQHGIRNGWFYYPFIYDPMWCLTKCNNYEKKLDTSIASV